MKITVTLLVLLVAVGIIFLAVRGRRVEAYRDNRVTAGEIVRPINKLAPHISATTYLSIHGRTFTGLRGLPPYYLDITNLDSLLFVTEDKRRKVSFWIVESKSDQAIQIDGDGSTFGWNIGSGRSAGEEYADWLEASSANNISLVTRSGSVRVKTVLDIGLKSISRVEVDHLDVSGGVTNHVVYDRARESRQAK